ncbi:hypothetical protein PBI_SCTP2_115 [Salicola phage SCTP-2]|nr:hypothetical protein PBI_SCTP2_115 [Salicola phage SCTP-2]
MAKSNVLISNKKLFVESSTSLISKIDFLSKSFYHKLSSDSIIFKNIYSGRYYTTHCFTEMFNDWYTAHQGILVYCALNNTDYPNNIFIELLKIHSIFKTNREYINNVGLNHAIETLLNDEQQEIINYYDFDEYFLESLTIEEYNKDNILIGFINHVIYPYEKSENIMDEYFTYGLFKLFFDYLLSPKKVNYEDPDSGEIKSKVEIVFDPIATHEVNASIGDNKLSVVNSLLGGYSDHVFDRLYKISYSMNYLTRSKFYEIIFKYYFYSNHLTKQQNKQMFAKVVEFYRPIVNFYGYELIIEPYGSVSFQVIDEIKPEVYQYLAQDESIYANEHLLNQEELRYYQKGLKINKIKSLG